jgi:hypothetical protein
MIVLMKARITQTFLLLQCNPQKRFNYANVPVLELGELKVSEYPERFGKPTLVGRKTTTEGSFDVVRFRDVKANLAGGASGRELVLEFKEGVLNGFFYVSSFDEDRTNADLTKMDEIKVGASTREDVARILGRPQGKARCPTVLRDFKDSCDKGKEIWAWTSADNAETRKAPLKASYVYVAFDSDGKVVDKETTEIEVPR